MSVANQRSRRVRLVLDQFRLNLVDTNVLLGRGLTMYAEHIPYTVSEHTDRYKTSEERSDVWEAASSLQEADGLHVSDYAERTAERYITGEISSIQLAETVSDYHESASAPTEDKEADVVAARIVKILNSFRFSLDVRCLMLIHRELFSGVDVPGVTGPWVGRFRTVNLSKPEPVLGGRSVEYVKYDSLAASLDYDFEQERSSSYRLPMDEPQIKRFSRFISHVWQAHPFREGNTRTTAVFSQLYLRALGIEVDNRPFRNCGKLYRDALVRANYACFQDGVYEDSRFIVAFYRSVIEHEPYPFNLSDLNLHGIRELSSEDVPYRGDRFQTAGRQLEEIDLGRCEPDLLSDAVDCASCGEDPGGSRGPRRKGGEAI